MLSANCIKYIILILCELPSKTESFGISNQSFVTISFSILFIFLFCLLCFPYFWFFYCVCRVKHKISSLSSLLSLFFWAILLNFFCLEKNLDILLMLVPSFGVSDIVLNTSLFPSFLKLQGETKWLRLDIPRAPHFLNWKSVINSLIHGD